MGKYKTQDWNSREDFFHYGRLRFLIDERDQLVRRRAKFDVNALAQIAAKASGSGHCVEVIKCPEGMSNKVFIMKMDDGSEVIAKVPNEGTGRPHFTTASEVATMEFARSRFNMPIPRILAWSSRAAENEVGAEYIIMEKVRGVQLGRVWPTMGIKKKGELIKRLFLMQRTWISFSFKRYGAIYFSQDLEPSENRGPLYVDKNGDSISDGLFAIGPTNVQDSFEDGRAQVSFDRGPWSSATEYYAAAFDREAQCVRNFPRPVKSCLALSGPNLHVPTRERKLEALDAALKTLELFLPCASNIADASFWHHDLHPENIFVDETDPASITGIIDWQFTEISPLFQCARLPVFLRQGEDAISDALETPQLPADYDLLAPEEKAIVDLLYDDQVMAVGYRRMAKKGSKKLHDALQYADSAWGGNIVVARSIFEFGEDMVLKVIADIVGNDQVWSEIPASELSPNAKIARPLAYTEDQAATIDKNYLDLQAAAAEMRALQARLGVNFMRKAAVVEPERYDQVKKQLQLVKQNLLAKYAKTDEDRWSWEQHWPFDN